jgi:hypothetical protein
MVRFKKLAIFLKCEDSFLPLRKFLCSNVPVDLFHRLDDLLELEGKSLRCSLIEGLFQAVEQNDFRKGIDAGIKKKVLEPVSSNNHNGTDNSFDIDLSGAVVKQELGGLGFHEKKLIKMSMKYHA